MLEAGIHEQHSIQVSTFVPFLLLKGFWREKLWIPVASINFHLYGAPGLLNRLSPGAPTVYVFYYGTSLEHLDPQYLE